MDELLDCIVVGGGVAGLSAALVLGRARRRTLLVDTGRQSNLVAHGIGGLLGSDTRPPADLYAAGRAELGAYPSVALQDGEVVDGRRTEAGFTLELADGSTARARRVLLATGMHYRHPDLPGLAALWGRSAFHCPFCHGWEVRERPLGVLDADVMGIHRATLLTAWSDDITLLTDGPAPFGEAERAGLEAAGVTVDERHVVAAVGDDDALRAVTFADGAELRLGGLLVATTLHQRSPLAARFGATFAEANPMTAESLAVDGRLQTDVPGLYAAGDLAAGMPSLANAIAAGSNAAAAIVGSLAAEVGGTET